MSPILSSPIPNCSAIPNSPAISHSPPISPQRRWSGPTVGVRSDSVNLGPRSPQPASATPGRPIAGGKTRQPSSQQSMGRQSIGRRGLNGAIAAAIAGSAALLLGASRPVLAQSPDLSLERSERPALPQMVRQAVLQEAASQSQAAPGELRILDFQAEVWPNGCLGLAQDDETCTQGLVSGWHVIASDGQQRWLYRTNANGQLVRSDAAGLASLTSRGDADGSLPSDRQFIDPPRPTTTAPRPEERQLPAARITPRNNRATITFINRSNAAITFEVIGDTSQRLLPGQRSTRLLDLPLPSTVSLRRQDGGLLRILPRQQGPAHALEVFLDVEIDLGLDRTTLLIEPDGSVFLN